MHECGTRADTCRDVQWSADENGRRKTAVARERLWPPGQSRGAQPPSDDWL
jgi:hypothetical protein